MKWEYYASAFFNGEMEEFTKQLNALGDEGWNLVTVTTAGLYIFKRVKG